MKQTIALRRIRRFLPRLFLLSLCVPGYPQRTAAPPAADAGSGRRITLDVVVSDKAGKPVTGLQKQDFTVLDNKQPARILTFEETGGAAEPAEVVLLADRVNVSFINAAREREETKKFLSQNGGHLKQPVSMVFLSDSGIETQSASRDGNELIAALDRSDSSLRTVNRSQLYAGAERWDMSLNALMTVAAYEGTRPGRKILIWLSPGWPLLAGQSWDMTAKERQGVFDRIVGASTALRQARITLDNVNPMGVAEQGVGATSYYLQFVKGIARPRQAEPANVALQVIAAQTGGRVIEADNDIPAAIAVCAADALAGYTLSFDAPTADGPDEYHALDVKVDRRGVTARTRNGYYAQP